MTERRRPSDAEKSLRARRDPYIAELKGMAEVVFVDETYRRILGPLTPEQRTVFFDAVATYAGMRKFGQTPPESVTRDYIDSNSNIEATSEGYVRQMRKLKHVGINGINFGMVQTAAHTLIDVHYAIQQGKQRK